MLGIIHCGLVTSFWNLNQLLRISQGSSWLTHSKVQNLSHESPYPLWLWLPLALSALAFLLFCEHSKNCIPQHLCTCCSLFLMLPSGIVHGLSHNPFLQGNFLLLTSHVIRPLPSLYIRECCPSPLTMPSIGFVLHGLYHHCRCIYILVCLFPIQPLPPQKWDLVLFTVFSADSQNRIWHIVGMHTVIICCICRIWMSVFLWIVSP